MDGKWGFLTKLALYATVVGLTLYAMNKYRVEDLQALVRVVGEAGRSLFGAH